MGSRRPRYSRCFSRYDPKEKFRRGGARSRSLRAIAEVSRGDVTGRINEDSLSRHPQLPRNRSPCICVVGRVLAIPKKRTDKRLVGYLTRDEMEAVLTAPDQSTWIGRRDYALLLTMYNSGARLSEMTCMQHGQVKFDSTTYLKLHGKGRKERVVPLWAKTARVLRNWFRECEVKATEVAFPSVRGTPLSSDGLNYILQQAVRRAADASCPSLLTKRVTPHLVRHYLPFRTMSCNEEPLRIWTGNFGSHRAKAPDIARHSLVPSTDCSGRRGVGRRVYFDPQFNLASCA